MANEEPVREPCLHCGEPASINARICPHCSNSLLVDVRLERGPSDSRQMYQLARRLSRIVPATSFIEVKRSLASTTPSVARGVTRETAKRVLSACAEFDVEGRFVSATRVSELSFLSRPPSKWIAVAAFALLVLGLGIWTLLPENGNSDAAPDAAATGETPALTTEAIAATASTSTVSLMCGNSVGSGFFVAADTVLTNAHVVCEDSDRVEVHFSDGRTLEGSVKQRDPNVDLATVEVQGANAAPLSPADSSELRAGEKIVVIGTPLGMAYSVHEGIISNTRRNVFGVNYIQIDANVNPGNSGGPLLNQRGEVVGVVSMKSVAGEGIGFALPINYAYDGQSPLFRASLPISSDWKETLAIAAEEEEREVLKARSAFRQPGFVQITPTRAGLVVIVILRSVARPSPTDLRAFLDVNGTEHCRGNIHIHGWGALESFASETEFGAELSWMRKHGISEDLWYGSGLFDQDACPDALRVSAGELVLEHGEEGYDRMPTGVP